MAVESLTFVNTHRKKFRVASAHIVSGNMEIPDDRRNLLASRVKTRLEGHGVASTCSSIASSKPIFSSSQDTSFVTLKVYGSGKIIRFQFPLTSGVKELKEEVERRLNLHQDWFNITYEDDEGDKILIPIDTDLKYYLTGFTSSVNPVIKLWIQYPIPYFLVEVAERIIDAVKTTGRVRLRSNNFFIVPASIQKNISLVEYFPSELAKSEHF